MASTNRVSGFDVTRQVVDEVAGWVQRLSKPLVPAKAIAYGDDFRWVFADESALVLVVAKAVRIASALEASVVLLDKGFILEAACLMRIVSDYSAEILAVCEGELRKQHTKAQREFISQFFTRKLIEPNPQPPEKQRFVGRDDLLKAHVRLGDAAGVDGGSFRDMKRTLDFGYDGYVHGSYSSAMELYDGRANEFMLCGDVDPEQQRIYFTAFAGKVHEAAVACGFIALIERDAELHAAIGNALCRLNESNDQSLD